MIPLIYSCRNLLRRPVQSIQLIIGSSLVVMLVMLAASMNKAMERTLARTGIPHNVILLGAGSEESVERSEVRNGSEQIIASSIPGILQTMGKPTISPEIHFNGMLSANKINSQALVRGVRHEALWVHKGVRILKGRFPESGEIMIGRLAHQKLGISSSALQIGKIVELSGEKMVISGIFDAIGTVMEAEVWVPLQDLMTYTQRDKLSCVVTSLVSTDYIPDIDAFTKQRLDLELVAIQETEYYAKLSKFYAPIRWMAWLCAILLSIGAVFGGLNTLYAAFSARIREFGAMQAIGFSRKAILISLTQESCVTAFIGSCCAFLISTAFLQDLTFPFSIGVFILEFDSSILIIGLVTGISLGIIGGLPPAWNCLRPTLPETLKS
jgi:putative ABC transport system permease protein